MKIYALLTSQETACSETALCESHYTPANKERVEREIDTGYGDDTAQPNTWTDCTENEMLSCNICGYPEEASDE